MTIAHDMEAATTEPHLLVRAQAAGERLTQPIALIGVIGMLIAAGATVIDVLLRWLANTGVPALNEIVAMSFAVAVAACVPSGLANGVGITMDMAERALSARVARLLRALGAVLLGAFFALLTWRMSVYAAGLWAQGRTTVILNLPQAPFIWATAVLLGIATAVQTVVSAQLLHGSFKGRWESRLTGFDVVALGIVLGLAFAAMLAVPYSDVAARWAQDHPATTVIIGFLLMWLCLMGLMPLAAVMGLIGVAGTALFIGSGPAVSTLATEAAGFLTNYQVAALPLFLMMGSFAAVAGLSNDVYRLAQAIMGRFRGGLAMATIGGCAGFGAVTGSSLATVATFGQVSLPQMRARNYAPHLAAGCVAAGGTLGALIPPSAPLIIFALLTEASIGQLFVAAVVPGLIALFLYLLTVMVLVRARPGLAPPAEKLGGSETLDALRQCGFVFVLFGAVIGGMYSGVFTAPEAAAVGAFGAFLIALVRGKLKREQFWQAITQTVSSTALIYTLIFGVLTFSFFIGVSALPERATEFAGNLQLPHVVVIAIILIIFLLLGCVMDSFSVMIVTIPIITPVILHMGYDLVWWGVVNLVVVELGLITPPFGLHLFVLKSMMADIPLQRLYWGVLPFCVADFLKLLLLIAFPILALWLPSNMGP